MPYKIVKKGSQWQVQKDSGKVMGTHDTREKAVSQLRAIYANEKDVKK